MGIFRLSDKRILCGRLKLRGFETLSEKPREIVMVKGSEKFIFNDEGIIYIWGQERAELTYNQAREFFKYY